MRARAAGSGVFMVRVKSENKLFKTGPVL